MQRTQIVGILNVTPDSYYDGGKIKDVDAAVAHARLLLEQGADIIDVGGRSTFPDAASLTEQEEVERTVPVIRAIHAALPQAALSIDTYLSRVAREAIEAGATMVNDVTAGRADAGMFALLASHPSVSIVLMYAHEKTARTTKEKTHYDDVIEAVRSFLQERKAAAIAAGIDASCIILDPGLGFFLSSDARYSHQIIARLPELLSLGCPLYLSPSRKSFLAGAENLPPTDRLPGTIAASAIAVMNGACYIRTHDVLEVRRASEIAKAIAEAKSER